MIKKLAWRMPTAVSFIPQRKPGEPLSLKQKRLSDTTTEYQPVEPAATIPDDDEKYTTLTLRNEWVATFHAALEWYSNQNNIPVPKVVSRNSTHSEIRLLGELVPPLRESDIHQLMLDHQSLSQIFESWSQVITPRDGHMIILSRLLLAVTNNLETIKTALNELGNEEVSKRLKVLEPLPQWAVRFLEIKKSLNR